MTVDTKLVRPPVDRRPGGEPMTDAVDEPSWRVPAAPVAVRVSDLMSRMTLAEKVAQLSGSGASTPRSERWPRCSRDAMVTRPGTRSIADGLGQLTRPFGSAPVEPRRGVARWPIASAR